MNNEQFQKHCKSLGLTTEQILMLLDVRDSNPVRLTGTGGKSVSSRYPSEKMGESRQTESRTVTRPAVIAMYEYNPDCYEYYDEPTRHKIQYVLKSGRNHAIWITPDYLSIELDGIYFDEWKTENELRVLAEKQPNVWFCDDNGIWHSPPREEAVAEYGAKFRVRTPVEIDFDLFNNAVFMQDYYDPECPPANIEITQLVCNIVKDQPGITLAELLAHEDISPDNIFIMIAHKQIFIDMSAGRISQPEMMHVFSTETEYRVYEHTRKTNKNAVGIESISMRPGDPFRWDGRDWILINLGRTAVYLQEKNVVSSPEMIDFPKHVFFTYIKKGKIIGLLKEDMGKNQHPVALEIRRHASTQDILKASRKFSALEKWWDTRSIEDATDEYEENVSEATLYKWQKRFRQAEQDWNDAFAGLIELRYRKGNRLPKLPSNVLELLNEFIEEKYETYNEPSSYAIWTIYKKYCEEEYQLTSASYQTFITYVNNRDRETQTLNRQGSRSARDKRIPYMHLTMDTPKHGNRPFEICHIDHTQLDIELVHSVTGKNLGKPWITLAIDAYTRKVIGVTISFDKPSYRSDIMVLHDIVRRYGRLPQVIVTDHGADFKSIDYQTLLTRYRVEPMYRPVGDPKHGNPIERLFKTNDTEFIHLLTGNTKASKRVRKMTKSTNPKNRAIWNIQWLYVALCDYLFDTYNMMEHPALGESPASAYTRGLLFWGERKFKHISYEIFKIEACPRVPYKNGLRTIEARGVQFNYVWFKPDGMRSQWIGQVIEVRHHPWNFGIVYAYIGNTWIECKSEYYALFQQRSWKQIDLLTTAIKLSSQEDRRKKHLSVKARYNINARLLANMLDKVADYEEVLIQRVHDAESMLSRLSITEDWDSTEMNERLLRLDDAITKQTDIILQQATTNLSTVTSAKISAENKNILLGKRLSDFDTPEEFE